MPAATEPGDSTDDLQFATAEPIQAAGAGVAAAGRICVVCKRPIASAYFAIRDKVLCPSCCELVKKPPAGSAAGRLFKAGLLGLGAGLAGALIWFLIRRFAHIQIGLVAVLVGFMVGKAVRKGSGNRGGRGYQVMAVVLTYCCIAANYMPDYVELRVRQLNSSDASSADSTGDSSVDQGAVPGAHQNGIGIAEVSALLPGAFEDSIEEPFRNASDHPIGLLIIGFALWEAWKFNRSMQLAITGPYQIGERVAGRPMRMGA